MTEKHYTRHSIMDIEQWGFCHIDWVGENTKITIWQFCVYTHPVISKFTIRKIFELNKKRLFSPMLVYFSEKNL